ncbi:MAG: NUDIX domain-containing protein [Paludibacter sp.]
MLFLIINDFWGTRIALSIVYALVVSILLYGYFLYTNIYKYLGVSYLVSTLIITLIIFIPHNFFPQSIHNVISEYILLFSFILILLLRKQITLFVSERTPKHLAMTNNLAEHFKIVWAITILLFVYTSTYTFAFVYLQPSANFLKFLREVYYGVLLFLICFEFIRVTLIRVRLFKEEWWPIVTKTGKVIGSIQSNESRNNPTEFMHPIIRVILIKDSKIFLQKHSNNDILYPNLWDVALSNHVKMSETVEQCIDRTSYENYRVKDLKPLLLSKYAHKNEFESNFIYLFLVCKLDIIEINDTLIDSVKWWTIQQIEDNLKSGIFTENFVTEFETLKRSGFLENGKYQCNCRLKEVVYEGLNKSFNA